MIKLLVSDMDGTLLNETQEISEFNLNAIKEAQKKGLQFMIATGRNYDTVKPMLDEYDLQCYCLLLNGAEIRDDKGNIIDETNMQMQDVKDSIEILKDYSDEIEFLTERGVYVVSDPESAKYYIAKRIKCLRPEYTMEQIMDMVVDSIFYQYLHYVNSYEEIYNGGFQIRKLITFFDEPATAPVIRKRLTDQLQVSALSSFPTNVEVNDIHAQKGLCLKKVISKMNIQPEEVAIFGDSFNDWTLFTEFKNSYATMNAMPEIKEMASEIIDYNYEDGVGKKILELIS